MAKSENPFRAYLAELPKKNYGSWQKQMEESESKKNGSGDYITLSNRQRTANKGFHQTAAQFVKDCESELMEKRGLYSKTELKQMDRVLLDCVHLCIVGLCEGYQHLRKNDWMDEENHSFVPALEQAHRLQALLTKYMRELGLDSHQADGDMWSQIHKKK